MSCDRYTAALADHACGADLSPEVEAHLASCVGCAARLARQRRAVEGLDAELQQLVAVEPSPFFVERVPAHVSESPARRPTRLWWWSAAAAAAVMALAAFLLSDDRQQPASAPVHADATTPLPSSTVTDQPSSAVVRDLPPPVEQRPRHSVRAQRQPATAAEPKVLVPPGQMQAVERYVALLRSGRLDTSALQPAASVDPVPAELVLGPLEIDPMTVEEIDATPSAVERRHEQERNR